MNNKLKLIIPLALVFISCLGVYAGSNITHNNILTSDYVFNDNSTDNIFSVNVLDNKGETAKNVAVNIGVTNQNGQTKVYYLHSDNNGLVKLPVTLRSGVYKFTTWFKSDEETNTVKVQNTETLIKTSDMVVTEGDNKSFESILTDSNNNPIVNAKIEYKLITNSWNKSYNVTTDSNGYSSLPIDLKAGNYTIQTIYDGSEDHHSQNVNNVIQVNSKPAEEPKVTKHIDDGVYYNFRSLYTTNMGIGQDTPYWCSCNALQQAIYHLTGNKLSESTLSSYMGGVGTAGAGHSQIDAGISKYNKYYGTNLKIKWVAFSSLGNTQEQRFDKLGDLLSREDTAIIIHDLYRYKYGHYEALENIDDNKNTVYVLNSLGSKYDSSHYYGYLETRSQSTMQGYISNSPAYSSIGIITK